MARLIDYGMRAEGIAGVGRLLNRRDKQCMGKRMGPVNIHVRLEAPKKIK
jgi:hypothetical protein